MKEKSPLQTERSTPSKLQLCSLFSPDPTITVIQWPGEIPPEAFPFPNVNTEKVLRN